MVGVAARFWLLLDDDRLSDADTIDSADDDECSDDIDNDRIDPMLAVAPLCSMASGEAMLAI